MPAVYFHIQWPDGQQERCYSPSTIISHYLNAGQTYSVEDFLQQAEHGLNHASERVRSKFGYYCSSAADQLQRIKTKAAQFEQRPHACVTVIQLL